MRPSRFNPKTHHDLTRVIIGCAFEVINELGAGFLESVYERSLIVALHQAGIRARSQAPITVTFRDRRVGEFYADILVEDSVIVELKAVKAITTQHQAQVINYLNAAGIEVGLLINFGNPRLEYRRLTRKHK